MSLITDGLSRLEDARALVGVLLCLDVRDICRFSAIDTHRQAFELADHAWCHLCETCWRSKSMRHRLTPERAKALALDSSASGSWREHYKRAAIEGRRQTLYANELQDLRWAFNFTPDAGGRGASTIQFIEFRASEPGSAEGMLIMRGYPPMPYELSSDGKVLDIANFPPHYVRRLANWEWEITNDNVTFVSCVGDDIEYTERGFVDDVLRQSDGALTSIALEERLAAGRAMPQHVLLLRLLYDAMRGRRVSDIDRDEESAES